MQAPGIVLGRLASSDPDETPTQYLIVGWDEDGMPVIADNDGKLRTLNSDEKITDLVFQT